MKILVTGSTGFIGTHVIRQLINQGHQVYALIRTQKKWKSLLSAGIYANPIFGQLDHRNASYSWIDRLPSDLDGVVHLAGVVSSHKRREFYRTNTHATDLLIKKLDQKYFSVNATAPNRFTFLLLSSLAALGPSDGVGLSATSAPINHYGKSKLMAEEALERHGPSTWNKIIVRAPIVVGPGDRQILNLFKIVKKGFYISVGKTGDNKVYSFICVHDLVDFIIDKFQSSVGAGPHIYYPAYPQNFTHKEFHQAIATASASAHYSKLKKITLPGMLIKTLGRVISTLAYIIPPLGIISLTADKSKELVCDNWTIPADVCGYNCNCTWNLSDSLKITAKDYQKRDLL